MNAYTDLVDDWPFWYGERPLLGFLTAGIWAAGGVCIEEFQTDKKPDRAESPKESYLGRGDLYFHVGKAKGNIEFKMHNLGISRSRDFTKFLMRKWKASEVDAAKGRQRGIPSFAGMFLRPYVGTRREVGGYQENLKTLIETAWSTLKPDALAWWCPVARVIEGEPDTKDWVVGAILIVKGLR